MYLLRTRESRERLAKSIDENQEGNSSKEILIRKIILAATAREDLAFWRENSPKTIKGINNIFESILTDPERGNGAISSF